MNEKNKILITENHSILRAGLHALLSIEPGFNIVGGADNGQDTLRLVKQFTPDLVMIDINMQETNGLSTITEIKKYYPATKILVWTRHETEQCIREALQSGASGYVLKDSTDRDLITALHSVLAGKVYLSPSISAKVINGFLLGRDPQNNPSKWNTLTEREREILKLIAEGRTSKFIAEHLGLSIKTIEKHRSNLMKKLDLHNISALTTFAIGQGLVATG